MRSGIDTVDNSRFRGALLRSRGRLRERLFSPEELHCNPSMDTMAMMFSAKESVAKALGTGFDDTLSWHDIRVFTKDSSVHVALHRRAREMAGGGRIILSVSGDGSRTFTFAVITEAEGE